MKRILNRKVSGKQFSAGRRLPIDNRLLATANCLLPACLSMNRKINAMNYAVAIAMLFLVTACGKPNNAKLVAEGRALMENQDCKTCHHPTNVSIGPAHKIVAEKYEYTDENVAMLAQRIIQGGSGTWGEIPMNPHPDLSPEDAAKIARYVLSLDGEQPK